VPVLTVESGEPVTARQTDLGWLCAAIVQAEKHLQSAERADVERTGPTLRGWKPERSGTLIIGPLSTVVPMSQPPAPGVFAADDAVHAGPGIDRVRADPAPEGRPSRATVLFRQASERPEIAS
jgi:hypothetical protein